MNRVTAISVVLLLLTLTDGPLLGHVPSPQDVLAQPGVINARQRAFENGTPFAAMILNGEMIDLSARFVTAEDSGLAHLSIDLGNGNTLTAAVGTDQFVTFGATTTQLTAGPTTYAFIFGKPIVPDVYSVATSTGGVSLTNTPGATATIAPSAVYPTYISGYGTVGPTSTNLGVDIGADTVTAPDMPPGLTTTAATFGPGANTFAPTFYDSLEVLLTYQQTGLGSVASWSGGVTLAVPEPTALSLMLLALLGVAGRRTR